MELSKYIACICEGTAERVIIDLLLDNNKLIFQREYFKDMEVLVAAIHEYKRVSDVKRGETTLADILK